MLLWINGPFGVGKTQTAWWLQQRLPGSVLCDPEDVGSGLNRMLPSSLRGDFQDLPAWRQGVYEVLDLVLDQHQGPVIAAMTLVDPLSFDETAGRLRDRGHDVCHVSLLADREVVWGRLRGRGRGRGRLVPGRRPAPRREHFATSRVDLCLERLQEPRFALQVWLDELTVTGIADGVAAAAGLALLPSDGGGLKGRLRRA